MARFLLFSLTFLGVSTSKFRGFFFFLSSYFLSFYQLVMFDCDMSIIGFDLSGFILFDEAQSIGLSAAGKSSSLTLGLPIIFWGGYLITFVDVILGATYLLTIRLFLFMKEGGEVTRMSIGLSSELAGFTFRESLMIVLRLETISVSVIFVK